MIIHWFRRDLRLEDNPALLAASHEAEQERVAILPVYIRSLWKKKHGWTGAPRQTALCEALKGLADALRAAGSRLVIRSGDPLEALDQLVRETGATAISFTRDPDPHGRSVEAALEVWAAKRGVRLIGKVGVTALPSEVILTGAGTPYRVFTAYSKAWLAHGIASPQGVPKILGKVPATVSSEALPTLEDWGVKGDYKVPPLDPVGVRQQVSRFFEGPVFEYKALRDLPEAGATSGLSVALRWGVISPRELVVQCKEASHRARTKEARESVAGYLNELIWREFYMAVLWHWPEVLEWEFQPQHRALAWVRPEGNAAAEEAFERWKTGTTGFPIVDAGMRQLAATGWMHNRVRMIVAMFLTKDLHLDWRLGEQYFMQQLMDGEIASNNGGWQWSAGTGADAAPYFRIQNPWTQTSKFDPEGEYIKEWVPELRSLPGALFCKPPRPGLRMAAGYPLPMVDHAKEREATLAMFQQ